MSSSAVWDVSSNWEDEAALISRRGGRHVRRTAGDAQVSWVTQRKERLCLGYLAAEAGAVGPAKDLGCRLAAVHFQRRIDDFTFFKVESERTCHVRVPGHDRLETDRVSARVD